MADVRSLLRNELASRKGASQPNTTGNRVSKKRKVDHSDGVMHKKLRSTDLESVQAAVNVQARASNPDVTVGEDIIERVDEDEPIGPEPPSQPEEDVSMTMRTEFPADSAREVSSQAVDEDEWAAFEREVVAPTKTSNVPAVVSAQATIVAAPVTTEELAMQQQSERISSTRSREAELAGEREDAARFLEEEFDEMDQLEERVRRLKQRREELRQKRISEETTDTTVADDQRVEDSGSEEYEDEDWDDWRFK
ncbi:hypothetical protein N7539_001027 [Penicillium diatomitis]|uniref:Uncharacterized protein n=1 Tax=Penicillium diatomitis TaxID=2819901 RepID=A0A9X0C2X0_9EURO|nr:uncharacterized protein N7539_001027 [Penicillium diatomitis]KAJ5495911.1 hypothetical protein N7539_001027 [Penicillium diatomitis]